MKKKHILMTLFDAVGIVLLIMTPIDSTSIKPSHQFLRKPGIEKLSHEKKTPSIQSNTNKKERIIKSIKKNNYTNLPSNCYPHDTTIYRVILRTYEGTIIFS